MKTLRAMLVRFTGLFRRKQHESEMNEELRAHLDGLIERNVAAGMSEEEARYAALRAFGGIAQIAERARDERRSAWLEQTWLDLRYAARTLAKSPGFTLTAVITLALGIGLVTIQFSFVKGALLRGLPFEGPDRIMAITPLDARGRTHTATIEQFTAWRETQRSFAGFAAHRREVLEVSGQGINARKFRGAAFSAGVLELLRVQPVLGRGFQPEDEKPGALRVLLLAHHVWQTHFDADPNIVGRAVRLSGEPATIVGVLPPKFAFPWNEEAWCNLRLDPAGPRSAPESVSIVGRLRDDTTLTTARAEFGVLVAQAGAVAIGDAAPSSAAQIWPFTKRPDDSKIVIVLTSLLAVVGGVLSIACLNVANLLSARALQRAHELALRSALGASRGRLVRQMLTESCLLALLGALTGVVLAIWAVPLVNHGLAVDPAKPFWIVVELDRGVLALTAGLTLAVGVGAGLIPALRATRVDAGAGLKDGATSAWNLRLGRVNRALVVLQVAVSCAILLATSALVSAAMRQSRLELPFDSAATLLTDVWLPERAFPDHAARLRFQTELLDRVRALPGVKTATISRGYPLQRALISRVEIAGRGAGRADDAPHIYHYNHAAPGFLRDVRIPLIAGRDFAPTDRAGTEPVAIVNDRFAQQFWPGESPLGKQIRRWAPPGAPPEPWRTIVGVTVDLAVDPVRHNGGMVVHVPLLQSTSSHVTLLVATAGDPRALSRPVRDIVQALSIDVPVENSLTVADHFEQRVAPGRVFGLLAFSFGASGLLLAAVGVYGVTSFAVRRRTREFGVRLALGAKPSDLLTLVFRQGLGQLAVGLVLGSVAGWFMGRPMAGMVTRIAGAQGLGSYLVVLAALTLALAAALWWPARRAAKVDPMETLRTE